jgi:hypothetical protein
MNMQRATDTLNMGRWYYMRGVDSAPVRLCSLKVSGSHTSAAPLDFATVRNAGWLERRFLPDRRLARFWRWRSASIPAASIPVAFARLG